MAELPQQSDQRHRHGRGSRLGHAFCRENDIALLHDAAYSEVGYDGYRPISYMQLDGAKDIGIEFHSLSKTYNMTGWRIGMAVGNAHMIKALFQIRRTWTRVCPRPSKRWPWKP